MPPGPPAENPSPLRCGLIFFFLSLSPPLQITVPDGRTLAGTLACLDPQGNIVLQDASAVGSGGEADSSSHYLGCLIVPPQQRSACALEVAERDVEEVRGAVEAATARRL